MRCLTQPQRVIELKGGKQRGPVLSTWAPFYVGQGLHIGL